MWPANEPAGRAVVVAVRRLSAKTLAINPRPAAIKARLDHVLSDGVAVAPPAVGPLMTAGADELLNVGV